MHFFTANIFMPFDFKAPIMYSTLKKEDFIPTWIITCLYDVTLHKLRKNESFPKECQI